MSYVDEAFQYYKNKMKQQQDQNQYNSGIIDLKLYYNH